MAQDEIVPVYYRYKIGRSDHARLRRSHSALNAFKNAPAAVAFFRRRGHAFGVCRAWHSRQIALTRPSFVTRFTSVFYRTLRNTRNISAVKIPHPLNADSPAKGVGVAVHRRWATQSEYGIAKQTISCGISKASERGSHLPLISPCRGSCWRYAARGCVGAGAGDAHTRRESARNRERIRAAVVVDAGQQP